MAPRRCASTLCQLTLCHLDPVATLAVPLPQTPHPMSKIHRASCAALMLGAFGALSLALMGALGAHPLAQIKSYTLEEMVQTADQGVYGQIIASRVERLDSEVDGPEHYFTTLTIQGLTLADRQAITVDVTFHGGFLNATEGVFNSEAPAADDVQVGKRIVAFYRWADDMGAGKAANALVAAHGGIYRTVETANGPAVLGRGTGYAVASNRYVEQLATAVHTLAAAKPKPSVVTPR